MKHRDALLALLLILTALAVSLLTFRPTNRRITNSGLNKEDSTIAIYDTDPNTTNRAEPTPQAPDEHLQRKSDGTTAITNKQDGSSGAYTSTKNGSILANDGTYNRALFGLLPDGSYGFKVSKPLKDVLTAPDEDLILNSAQNTLKVAKVMTYSYLGGSLNTGAATWGSNTSVDYFLHELSYTPHFLAYIVVGSTYYPMPYTYNSLAGAGAPYWFKLDIATDSTKVYIAGTIQAFNANVSYGPYTVKVFLLQEDTTVFTPAG